MIATTSMHAPQSAAAKVAPNASATMHTHSMSDPMTGPVNWSVDGVAPQVPQCHQALQGLLLGLLQALQVLRADGAWLRLRGGRAARGLLCRDAFVTGRAFEDRQEGGDVGLAGLAQRREARRSKEHLCRAGPARRAVAAHGILDLDEADPEGLVIVDVAEGGGGNDLADD